MVLYGQVIIGPPGSGKTTYTAGMSQFCSEIRRSTIIVNLDFANDSRLPYSPDIDVRSFISVESVMESYALGPNGGLVFCMEALNSEEGINWLVEKIESAVDILYNTDLAPNSLDNCGAHIIFDCPGQVELYSHHSVVKDILTAVSKHLDLRLTTVLLLDSFYCSQPTTFISAVILATATMLRLGFPHINVLSKVDLLKLYGSLPFSLDFFTELLNISPLLKYLDGSVPDIATIEEREAEAFKKKENISDEAYEEESEDSDEHSQKLDASTNRKTPNRFKALTSALCEVIDSYAMVSFIPLNIEDPETVGRVLAAADKANGCSMARTYSLHMEQIKRREASLGINTEETVRASVYNGAIGREEQKDPKKFYDYASDQMESLYSLSLDIQERYGES